jgi:hypothetical protein
MGGGVLGAAARICSAVKASVSSSYFYVNYKSGSHDQTSRT